MFTGENQLEHASQKHFQINKNVLLGTLFADAALVKLALIVILARAEDIACSFTARYADITIPAVVLPVQPDLPAEPEPLVVSLPAPRNADLPLYVPFDDFINLNINRLKMNVGEFGGNGGYRYSLAEFGEHSQCRI